MTILRFTRRSTDRRDRCVGNSGAITFKFKVQFSFECTKKPLREQARYIKFESREISKGIPREKRGLTIWTERTILILKYGCNGRCNVSAVVQYTSHCQLHFQLLNKFLFSATHGVNENHCATIIRSWVVIAIALWCHGWVELTKHIKGDHCCCRR